MHSPGEAVDDRSPEAYLLSLLKKVLGGDLEPQKLVAAIAAYGRPQLEGSALALRLADAVWLAWAELEGSQDAEKKERLLAGLQHCLQEKLVRASGEREHACPAPACNAALTRTLIAPLHRAAVQARAAADGGERPPGGGRDHRLARDLAPQGDPGEHQARLPAAQV